LCVNFSPSSHGLASSPNMVMTITFGLMVSGSLAKAGALASRQAAEAARATVRMDRFMGEAGLSDRIGDAALRESGHFARLFLCLRASPVVIATEIARFSERAPGIIGIRSRAS